MSPRNEHYDDDADLADFDLPPAPRRQEETVIRNPLRRSKRIKSGRRAGAINGMQRRRNKRVDW